MLPPIALIIGPQTRDFWASALKDQNIAVRAQADTRAEELEQQTRTPRAQDKSKADTMDDQAAFRRQPYSQ